MGVLMKVIEKLKNLFKKKITDTNELVRPLDIIKIPNRKEFNNDTLVNYYKDEYHKILSSMKDYDPLYLEADELNNHIKMAVKLLFNISIKEDEIREKSVEARINYLVNRDKLDLYKNDINKLQSEVTGRLIALSEIRKELFLSKKKKEALDNVINRLCLSLNVLYSLEVSIISNIERYKSESKYNYEPSEEEKEEEYEIIKEKIQHLNWLQQVLPLNEQILIRDDLRYLLNDLATLEKKLEEYTYTHKNEITAESKNHEIDNLLKIAFDMEHKEELLKRIEQVERKYRLFYEYRDSLEYGDIAVDESDLTNIYNLKFSALTISKDGIVEAIDDETDKIELQYYENVIFSMVQDIIMGRNEYFNELFSGDLEEAVSLLIDGIKCNDGKINYGYILKDNYLFNLLLALEKSELPSLYDNYKDHMLFLFEAEPLPFYNDGGFYLEDYIPLNTYYFFKENVSLKKPYYERMFLILRDSSYTKKTFITFYKLFFGKVNKDSDKYYLPDGIKGIDRTAPRNNFDTYGIFEAISSNSHNKTVILPGSLKKIIGSMFNSNCQVKEVILNEGLVHLQKDVFANQTFDSVTIPSTVEYIESSVFNFETLKSMKFNNRKLSNFITVSYELFKDNFNLIRADNLYKSKLEKIIFHYDELTTDIEIELSYIGGSKYDKFTNNYYLMNSFFAFIFRRIYDELIERLNNLQAMFALFNKNVFNYETLEASLFDIPEESGVAGKLEELLDKVIRSEKALDEFINDNYAQCKNTSDELKWHFWLLGTHIVIDLKQIDDLINRYKNYFHMPRDFKEDDICASYKIKYLAKIKDMVITNADFYNLYNLKYRTYLLSNNSLSNVFFNRVDDEDERDYYLQITNDKINKILKETLSTLDQIKGEDYNEMLNILRNIFIDENGHNRTLEVLNSSFLLSFLNIIVQNFFISNMFPKDDELAKIFKDITLKDSLIITDENILKAEGIFTYDRNFINLGTALLLKYFGVIKGDIKINYNDETEIVPDELAKFYFLYQKHRVQTEDYFYLPLGISDLRGIDYNFSIPRERDMALFNYIKENIQNKILVLPSSLRHIKGTIDIPLKDIVLNEGLVSITGYALSKQLFTSLNLPSSLKRVDSNALNTHDLQTICINEEALAYGEKYFQEILKGFPLNEFHPDERHYHSIKLGLQNIIVTLNNGERLDYKLPIFEMDYLNKNVVKHVNGNKKKLYIHYMYDDLMKNVKGFTRKRR